MTDQTRNIDPELLLEQIAEWQAEGVISTNTVTRLRRHVLRKAASQAQSGTLPDTVPTARSASSPSSAARAVVEFETDGVAQAEAVQVAALTLAAQGSTGQKRAAAPFTWRGLAESLLAERTLNTLLALGAFLILSSALVISIFNPTRLPIVPHMGVLVGTTALFYAAGWFCYSRMRLLRAGEALLGIAAALVPLDVWSAGGAEGLGVSTTQLWLAGSLIALPIYAASYAALPGRVFAWLSAAAGGSLLMAALAIAHVPLEWQLASLIAVGVVYTVTSRRLAAVAGGQSLATALFWSAQLVAPPVLVTLLVIGRDDVYALGAAWWLAVGLYVLAAYQRRREPFEAVAACLAPVAFLLTLTRTPLDLAWYGVCLVGLAAVYQGIAAVLRRAPWSPVGVVATVLAVLGPIWALSALLSWAVVAALAADAVVYSVLAARSRSAGLAFPATAACGGAFVLGLHLLGWRFDQPWSWLILTGLLGGFAEVLLRIGGEQRRKLVEVVQPRGAWRAYFAPAAFDLACLSGLVAVCTAPFRGAWETAAVLLLVAVAAGLISRTRRSAVFLYPATVFLAAGLWRGVHAASIADEMLLVGLLLTLLAAVYGVIGLRLPRPFRVPVWLGGLVLSVLGPFVALVTGFPERQAVVAVACVAIFCSALALVRRPAWAYPVVLWTFVAFELVVSAIWQELPPGELLALLVVPGCLSLLVAELLGRFSDRRLALLGLARSDWARPVLIGGVVGVALSLAGASTDSRSGLVVCVAYAAVMSVLAMRHGTVPGERWLALAFLLGAGLDAVALLDLPRGQQPPVFMAGALVLALLCLWTARSVGESVRAWRTPLLWSTAGVAAAAELFALSQLPTPLHTASSTTALGAVVLLTIAYTRRDRRLAYCGLGGLVLAGLFELAAAGVSQPQAFVLPIGMYLGVVAFLECRRADPARLKAQLEIAALMVLLGTTLAQSLGFGLLDANRSTYEVGLLIEGLAVLGVGALLHWWRSLLAGAGAMVAAVLIMLAEPLAHVDTWYLVGSIGLVLIAGVVFLERRRQQIPLWLDGFRERLEAWA